MSWFTTNFLIHDKNVTGLISDSFLLADFLSVFMGQYKYSTAPVQHALPVARASSLLISAIPVPIPNLTQQRLKISGTYKT